MANRKTLLVEGKDDEHVLEHICIKRGIPMLNEIVPHESDVDLLKDMSVRIRATNEEGDIIGIVIDADKSLHCRWQSISNRLVDAGYSNVPPQPNQGGTILEPSYETLLPKVGVWIMPNNNEPGKLENFLRFLVPEGDTLLAHADDVLESLPVKRFVEKDKPKALMHTWLAWQKSPGRPYGTAIKADFLNANVPQADVLVSWLKELFFQEGLPP